MEYRQLGEMQGIGATCHYLKLGGKNIVIDCGIGFERNGSLNINTIPAGNFLAGKHIDLIIVTHSHADHIGAMPRLAGEHPEALVVISKTALAVGKIMLEDSLKIGEQDFMAYQERGEKFEMIFDHRDLENFLTSDQLEIIDRPCWLEPWPGWKIGFSWAGHTPGAMMTFLSPPNDRPGIVTGDTSRFDQEIVDGALMPDKNFLNGFLDQPKLAMIMEGTNGLNTQLIAREKIVESFIKTVNEVKNRGGRVLLPTFASNRSANIAAMLVNAGFIPHVDGLARKVMAVELPNFDELVGAGKIILFEQNGTAHEHRRLIAEGNDPCGHEFSPIISPSATMDKGYSVAHAQNILPDTKNALIFTGHMFENSTAKQILEIERGRTVNLTNYKGELVPVNVRCDVHHFDFTAHDYKDGLVERVKKVQPKDLIIHHCTQASFNALAKEIGSFKRPPIIHHGKHCGK